MLQRYVLQNSQLLQITARKYSSRTNTIFIQRSLSTTSNDYTKWNNPMVSSSLSIRTFFTTGSGTKIEKHQDSKWVRGEGVYLLCEQYKEIKGKTGLQTLISKEVELKL